MAQSSSHLTRRTYLLMKDSMRKARRSLNKALRRRLRQTTSPKSLMRTP